MKLYFRPIFSPTLYSIIPVECQARVWCLLQNAGGKGKWEGKTITVAVAWVPCSKVRELENLHLRSLQNCLLRGIFSSRRASSLKAVYLHPIKSRIMRCATGKLLECRCSLSPQGPCDLLFFSSITFSHRAATSCTPFKMAASPKSMFEG